MSACGHLEQQAPERLTGIYGGPAPALRFETIPFGTNNITSLARLAPQESGNLELVLFDCPGLIGAAAMRVHRRLRSFLRGRRMLRTFAVLGMDRTRLLLRVDLPLCWLPRGRLPVARAIATDALAILV